jgi:predicted esterase
MRIINLKECQKPFILPPIYIFHGIIDTTVPSESSNKFHLALRNLELESYYTTYKEVGHAELVFAMMQEDSKFHSLIVEDVLKIVKR